MSFTDSLNDGDYHVCGDPYMDPDDCVACQNAEQAMLGDYYALPTVDADPLDPEGEEIVAAYIPDPERPADPVVTEDDYATGWDDGIAEWADEDDPWAGWRD